MYFLCLILWNCSKSWAQSPTEECGTKCCSTRPRSSTRIYLLIHHLSITSDLLSRAFALPQSFFFYSAVDEQEGTFFLNPGNCRFFPHSHTALILILKEQLVFVSIWTFTSHPLCACTREVCLKSVQVYLLLPESAGTPQYGEETDVAKTQWAGVRCMEA